MRHYIRILAIAALAAGAVGCDENLSSLAGPTPNLEPTFASIQANILESTDSAGRIACTNCHTNVGRNPSANLNLSHDTAYDQLVNRVSGQQPGLVLVKPGDPNNSYLIHKIEGRPTITNLRMPRNSPAFLTDGQILVIKRWIEIGAPR
jgi:Planctomycete cytochrome C